MNEFEKTILENINNLDAKNKKIAVALSGGCDSLSLTIALKNIGIDIIAILVNHNLRAESKKEINDTIKILKKFKIKYIVKNWNGNYRKNLEAEAREARYKLLIEACNEKKINILCVGHHADDQIETFFMNLARGSGLDGLCCIPHKKNINNIQIVRPMLELTKQDCKNYLLNLNLEWCEDKSNFDLKYKRNKLRFLLNEIEDKKLITKRIINTIKTLQEVRETLEFVLEDIEKKIIQKKNNEIIFSKKDFLNLTQYIQKSILAKYIMLISGSIYKPRLYKINNIIFLIKTKINFKHTISNLEISCKKDTIIIKKIK